MAMTALASASFAHLLGRAPKASAKKAEDNERDRRDDETEEEYKNRLKKLDEKEEEDDAKKAESDDPKEEDDDEEKPKDKAKAKAKPAADDEGDDGESGEDDSGDDTSDGGDMRKKGTRSARLRERARCAAIFADAAAGKNPALAAQLAFATDLPRTQAINVLRAGGLAVPSGRNRLDERMAQVKVPVVGASDPAPPAGGMSFAERVVLAGKKRRGEI